MNNYKLKLINIISLIFSIFYSTILLSDVPHTDIIEVLYNNKKYFVSEYFNEGGVLKNHDLCYYDYSGDYIGEVREYIRDYSKNNDSIFLYSSMEKINIKKLTCYEYKEDGNDSFDDVLKIFNDGFKVSINDFIDKFILLDAYHGNTGGFTFSRELKETDNIWLSQYQIETLFCMDGHDICNFGFFTIKGNLNKKEKRKLEIELKSLLSNDNLNNRFWQKISELYRRQIVMVGFCSC